jgi:hypothetical protein
MQKGKFLGVKREIKEERVGGVVGHSDVQVATDKPVDTIGNDKRISAKLVSDVSEQPKQGDVTNVLADNQQRNGDVVASVLKEDKDKKEEVIGIKKLIQQYEPHAHATSHVKMIEHKKEQVAIEGYKGGVKDRIKNWEEKTSVEDKDSRDRTK